MTAAVEENEIYSFPMQRLNPSSLRFHLTRLLAQGTEKKVFAGATAAIVTGSDGNRHQVIAGAGVTRLDGKGVAVVPKTIFDLASLTKPLATALGILLLVDRGHLHLNDRLADLCPLPVPPTKKEITVAQLLSHSSGLPPYKEYFRNFPPDTDNTHHLALLAAILDAPLAYPTGRDCRYSDLGFILLGEILERISGISLDAFFLQNISRPLHIENELFFRRRKANGAMETDMEKITKFAATENCPWRQRTLQGEVHDEHCHLLGGAAGHAGLFGTAAAVSKLCAAILDGVQGRTTALPLSRTVLKKALSPQYPGHTWCLGFDTPSLTGYTSAGNLLSRRSVGHLGFTGTSFWIDPAEEITIVLLSNRIHPSRENKKIRDFRPWFHDQVLSFIINGK